MLVMSFELSLLAVFILLGKFGVSAVRRWKKRHDKPWRKFLPSVEPVACLILISPKVLVLVFSIQQNEKLLLVSLSLAARCLVLYQVGCLRLVKGTLLICFPSVWNIILDIRSAATVASMAFAWGSALCYPFNHYALCVYSFQQGPHRG
jgi:hypothetical protein